MKKEKDIIIAIVGPSGSGKTSVSKMLQHRDNIPMLISHTTRPIREGEIDGIDHYFIEANHNYQLSEMLARATFGNHDYFMLFSKIPSGKSTYVVDEQGLLMLLKQSKYKIYSIYINSTALQCKTRGVDIERIKRDRDRELLPLSTYNLLVNNNTTLEDLYQNIRKNIMVL